VQADDSTIEQRKLALPENGEIVVLRDRLGDRRPSGAISYTHDNYDAYVDSAGVASAAQWATTTIGTAGVEVGRVFNLGGDRCIEPWLGVTALLESASSSQNALVRFRLSTYSSRPACARNSASGCHSH
jgi:hypothetical protein